MSDPILCQCNGCKFFRGDPVTSALTSALQSKEPVRTESLPSVWELPQSQTQDPLASDSNDVEPAKTGADDFDSKLTIRERLLIRQLRRTQKEFAQLSSLLETAVQKGE